MDTKEFVEAPRHVTADWHLARARNLIEYDKGRMLDNVLIYCAIDLRLCIERFAFELLVMAYDLKLDPLTERQINQASRDIFKLLLRDFPELEKRLKFLNLVMEFLLPGMKTAIIDLDWLKKKRGELSNICHLQLRPDPITGHIDEDFKQKGFELFKEILDRFTEWLQYPSAFAPVDKMPYEVQELQKTYLAGDIDDAGVITGLKQFQPDLQKRLE